MKRFPLITKTPGVVGGEPCIKGTRISVRIIAFYYRDGLKPEGIREHYPHLSILGIEEAIKYYKANKKEVVGHMERNEMAYTFGRKPKI